MTYVQSSHDYCQYPQIISQTLTSNGVLTQILPESTTLEMVPGDNSVVVQKDSVAGSTKILNVRGPSYNISLDNNRLIIKDWSEIGMLLIGETTLQKEYL